jgi:hypothetical protein
MSHVMACRRCGEPLGVSPSLRLTGPERGQCFWSVRCENMQCVGRVGGEQAGEYYYDLRDAMVRSHWSDGKDCDCETCSELAASGELRRVLRTQPVEVITPDERRKEASS